MSTIAGPLMQSVIDVIAQRFGLAVLRRSLRRALIGATPARTTPRRGDFAAWQCRAQGMSWAAVARALKYKHREQARRAAFLKQRRRRRQVDGYLVQQLRMEGWSWAAVARALGLKHREQARRALRAVTKCDSKKARR